MGRKEHWSQCLRGMRCPWGHMGPVACCIGGCSLGLEQLLPISSPVICHCSSKDGLRELTSGQLSIFPVYILNTSSMASFLLILMATHGFPSLRSEIPFHPLIQQHQKLLRYDICSWIMLKLPLDLRTGQFVFRGTLISDKPT